MRSRGQVGDESCIGLCDLQKFVGRAESGSFDGTGDVEHRVALGHHDGVKVDLTAGEPAVNITGTRGFFKQILSGLQRAAVVEIVPKDKGPLVAYHSGSLEFGRDTVSRVSRAKHHEGIRRRSG